MKLGFVWGSLAIVGLAILLSLTGNAQSRAAVTPNGGQASQPVPAANGPAGVSGNLPAASNAPAAETTPAASTPTTTHIAHDTSADDNPYDPLLEPPPLPKGKTTLVGGIATSVDKVRNRVTVQPFGKGAKMKLFLDERSHIYRNGTETTILGIHKGDRVYVDTMLADNSRVFARNVRVLTDTGVAEVRGQVMSVSPERGTINLRDQLSSKPVTVAINAATKYGSTKGAATAADIQPGSLIDVQFSPRRDRAEAQEITLLAKPGDNYIFSGVVTSMDLRTSSFFVDNKTDNESYEVHFSRSAVSDPVALKVGAEVTARATFDGKQYTASNVRVEKSEPSGQDQRSEVQ
jgi:hypothetical protein